MPSGGSEVSRSHAVPAPNAAPLLTPASSRPANSSTTLRVAPVSSTLATSDIATAGTTTARRPLASDSGPAISGPGISPSAYTPNTASSVPVPRPSA